MRVDAIAQLTLLGYAIALAGLVLWRAASCPAGWQRWLLYSVDALYCRLCFHWRSNRACPFDREGAAIVIANHRGPVDPQLIWLGVRSLRPIGFLTAREYYEKPGLNFICRHLEAIPTERSGRDMAATRAALRRLQEGKILGIFPEGKINRGTGLLPANPGIGWLALKSKAPVYPVFVQNAPSTNSMVRTFFDFRPVRVLYGEAVDLSAWYDRGLSAEIVAGVTNHLMQKLAELGGISYSAGAKSQPDGSTAT